MIDHAAINDLIDWMIDGARPSASAKEIIDGICSALVAAGLPIDRFALFIYTLDPNIVGRRFTWTPDKGTMVSEGKMGLFSTDEYTVNPLPTVIAKQISIRRRLTDPQCPRDYKIVDELIADGFTDYLVQPLIYTTGETNAASWSSKAPAGFSDEAVDVLFRVNKPLARLTETYLLRLNAATILSAYTGRNSGDQILKGMVHRGDGGEIDAAILFTDLIGFTALSNTKTGPEIVSLLNEFFDVMVPPVEASGGEILKFLGDGFFAIFPYGEKVTLGGAVRAASEAVMEGEQKLADTEIGKTVAFRSAIHAGRFHYGNIGGANRLDFTAIGRPVNYTARLLSAASGLSETRVASAETADYLCVTPRFAGEATFKGFEGLQPVFAY